MKKTFLIIVPTLLVIIFVILGWRESLLSEGVSTSSFVDVARLYPQKILRIESPQDIESLKEIVINASKNKQTISLRGSGHSQGGHTYYKNGIVVDMKEYDEIISFNEKSQKLTVQSGATWEDIQAFLAPKGFALKVMQSSYVFTVGGTLSANAHGRDLEKTTIVEVVDSFTILLANGEIVTASRTQNKDIFSSAIGGYGLIGIILDVTLDVTKDEIYEKYSVVKDYNEIVSYVDTLRNKNNDVELMLLRPSIDTRSPDFLKKMSISLWKQSSTTDDNLFVLQNEKNVTRDMLLFDLSRRFEWARTMRWNLQDKLVEQGANEFVSRNNSMRPPTAPLEFLDYHPRGRTDVLQEYYIPKKNFVSFMDSFREIILEEKVNIISSTIRFIKANDEVLLSHTPTEDSFAIIVMANVGLDSESLKKTESSIQKIVDKALENKGTYYLTYQLFPTQDQFRKAYPKYDQFNVIKNKYDPSHLFMNNFYDKYYNNKEIEYGWNK